jgi:hypothetical protein
VQPTRRDALYDTYWRFAAERQAIFLRRARGEPPPWTDDPILRRFKFCNTYRAADRVTQYLIREVIYGHHGRGLAPEDTFLRIVLFRLFSKESTWAAIEAAAGGLTRASYDEDRLGDLLDRLKAERSIYTAAFILAAPSAFGHRAKHRNHLALVSSMFRAKALGSALARARSLKEIYGALVRYPAIGPFLGYQIAVDLNYTDYFDFSENEFTVPGPGAVRGLRKVFTDLGDRTPQQVILDMVERQEEEFARLGLTFTGLFGRPLHAIDCQSLFCETDKYARRAFPELKSERVRIKQEFRPSRDPLALFFPPRWQMSIDQPPAGGPEPAAAPAQLALEQSDGHVEATVEARRAPTGK